MAGPVFEMLLAHDGSAISINGTTKLRRGVRRPEIIAPSASQGELNHNSTSLNPTDQLPRPGSIVRLINPGYLSAIGRVRSLPPSRRGVTTGQLERLAEVEVAGTRLILPFADLEVLG
jgi:hypothetical protein